MFIALGFVKIEVSISLTSLTSRLIPFIASLASIGILDFYPPSEDDSSESVFDDTESDHSDEVSFLLLLLLAASSLEEDSSIMRDLLT